MAGKDNPLDPTPTDDTNPTPTDDRDPTGDEGSGGDDEGSDETEDDAELVRTKAELEEEKRKNAQLLSERGNVERQRRENQEQQEREKQLASQRSNTAADQAERLQVITSLNHRANSEDYSAQERQDAREKLVILKGQYEDGKRHEAELRRIGSESKMERVMREAPDDPDFEQDLRKYVDAGYDPKVALRIVRDEWREAGKLKPTEPKPGGSAMPARAVSEARTTLRGVPAREHAERVASDDEIARRAAALESDGNTDELRSLWMKRKAGKV